MNDMSILRLVLDASLLVQLVMLSLVAASVMSWAVILKKRRILREAREAASEFEERFWSGGDLAAMYQRLEREEPSLGMTTIFEAGFREFARLNRQGDIPAGQVLEGTRRAMRVAHMRESDRLVDSLGMLATIGSTSPYIGLFGTVWGIMNSFRALGNVQSATLSMVAPGIAEALIATAMGLFAAIPAVIAYNRYSEQVSRLDLRYDTFLEEFAGILQRNLRRAQPKEASA